MRLTYHAARSGMQHGMTFAVALLIITAALISFLCRNWDNIMLRFTTEEAERKFKIVIGIILAVLILSIIGCCAAGLYDY